MRKLVSLVARLALVLALLIVPAAGCGEAGEPASRSGSVGGAGGGAGSAGADEADDDDDDADDADDDDADEADDDSDDADDVPLTGKVLERASAAALAHTGGGRVTEAEEADPDEGGRYEVEVTLDDGSEVELLLDESFNVVGEEREGPDDD